MNCVIIDVMVKMKKILSVRNILSVLTLILVGVVAYEARGEVKLALMYLGTANIFVILLLIPEQLFMYYCAGQMFFSYMKTRKGISDVPKWTLARIAFELNFVNHALPSGGVSGLGYITWRLRKFGSTAGQTSFMYILRYFITIMSNQSQTLLAILALFFMNVVPERTFWVVWMALAVSLGIILGAVLIIYLAMNKKRVQFVSKIVEKVAEKLAKVFKRKHHAEHIEAINRYFNDLYESLAAVKKQPKTVVRPIAWGVVYSFFEIATYWIVAISLGHPEVLPQIMVSEAIGSTIGAVMPTPGGAGGYEGAMIFVMVALGVDAGLAAAIVIPARVIVLVGTIVSGYGFYQHAISMANKKEIKEMKELGE